MQKVIKSISKIVTAGTEDTGDSNEGEYVPANGEQFNVYQFAGQSPSSTPSAKVKLYWDYGGAGEELLWTIQDDEPMPDWLEFKRTGDGIKKFAIVLDNGCQTDWPMSGSFRGEIIDG